MPTSQYPYAGISRSNSCVLQESWGMYSCPNGTDYRILIIEGLDSYRSSNTVFSILSDDGYIDLSSGPRTGQCEVGLCSVTTFYTAIIQSGRKYKMYYESSPPNRARYRIIDGDSQFKAIISIYYGAEKQVDVYANEQFIPPTNFDTSASSYLLLDRPNNVTLVSPSGSNYFDRYSNRVTYCFLK